MQQIPFHTSISVKRDVEERSGMRMHTISGRDNDFGRVRLQPGLTIFHAASRTQGTRRFSITVVSSARTRVSNPPALTFSFTSLSL